MILILDNIGALTKTKRKAYKLNKKTKIVDVLSQQYYTYRKQ